MSLKSYLHEIIFEAETLAGRIFDIFLLWAIGISTFVVVLDSVPNIHENYSNYFMITEWVLAGLFAMEYLLRIYCIQQPLRYIFSFYGLIDLLAIAPALMSLMLEVNSSLLIIRAVRLIRVFRIFKLGRYVREAKVLKVALESSRAKITVFLGTVLIAVLVMGTLMYLIEGEEYGFSSIPLGIYWAIVTMTTVGYGDLVPHTVIGKILAGTLMILGYGVLAVPTGIVSVELAHATQKSMNTLSCQNCSKEGHDFHALFCDRCGEKLVDASF